MNKKQELVDKTKSDLELARRTDWRFLIPQATLNDVAILGRADMTLLRALEMQSRSLQVLPVESEPNAPTACNGAFDLVVLRSSRQTHWQKAYDLLAQEGALYCEIDRSETRGLKKFKLRKAEAYVNRMRSCGFSDVRIFWHWPNFESCSRIMPLEDHETKELFFSDRQKRLLGKMRQLAFKLLHKIGLLSRVVPCFSIIGVKSDNNGRNNKDIILRYLEENWQRLNLSKFGENPELSSLILTPRFKASAHIVFMVLQKGYKEPILAIKVPRITGNNYRLEVETENLDKLHAVYPDNGQTTPRVVALKNAGKDLLMIRTAVGGRPMSPSFVRSNPEQCIDVVLSWLIEIDQSTKSNNKELSGWFEQLIEDPLRQFNQTVPTTSLENMVIDRTREITAPLASREFPLVFEHGDLSSPNILIKDTHQISVIDWELAKPAGLPGSDLFFFLTYIAFSLEKANTYRQYLSAFGKAFFTADSWARPYVLRFSKQLEIEPEILSMVFVTCWSRYVASLVTRLTGSEGHLAEKRTKWLRSNRYYGLWLYTVKNINQLNIV